MTEPMTQPAPSFRRPFLAPPVVFAERFQGPPGTANGGFAAGMLAEALVSPALVTLLRPVPLGRPLRIERGGGRATLWDGDVALVTAEEAEPRIDVPGAVSIAEAEAAAARFPQHAPHPFPRCFACGPLRERGDALRLLPGPTADGSVVAAPWIPDPRLCRDVAGAEVDRVPAPLVWAALDCPGAWSVFLADGGPRPMVLGRIAARVIRAPRAGARHAVLGWRTGQERRKHFCGTAIFDEHGELCAYAKSTWITLA